MSSAATINKTLAAKPKKEKRDKPQQPPANERLKTVVRRLPRNLPEDIFWQSVQTWVTDDTVT
jgi:regulator of nonsense transcripts 3